MSTPETTLELVDAALAEGRPTATLADEREWQLLALAVRDETTPAPDPGFAAEMDDWAAAGFGRRAEQPRAGLLDRTARALRSPLGRVATAGAVAAAVAAVVVTSDWRDLGDARSSGGGGATTPADVDPVSGAQEASPQQRSLSEDAVGAGAAEPPSPGTGSIAPGEDDRRIERLSELTLAAPADDFQAVADRIVAVTDRHGGFVLRSNVATGEHPTGYFQLRVPADQLQPALRALAGLGDVRARSDSGQDVTPEYVSVSDRLDAARAERRALLRRLAVAVDLAQIQRLRDRIDRNARELASLRREIRMLRERTNYAAVSVSLVERTDDRDGGASSGGTSDALDDSLALLVGSFNWLLRALGVLIPVGLVGGAAWWAARAIRRRRREAVLF